MIINFGTGRGYIRTVEAKSIENALAGTGIVRNEDAGAWEKRDHDGLAVAFVNIIDFDEVGDACVLYSRERGYNSSGHFTVIRAGMLRAATLLRDDWSCKGGYITTRQSCYKFDPDISIDGVEVGSIGGGPVGTDRSSTFVVVRDGKVYTIPSS